jgi:hypothetical protein
MAKGLRFSLRRMIAVTTVVAVGCAALAFRMSRGWSGAWRDAADFAQIGIVFTAPFLALTILFDRPLFFASDVASRRVAAAGPSWSPSVYGLTAAPTNT